MHTQIKELTNSSAFYKTTTVKVKKTFSVRIQKVRVDVTSLQK
jgi:hypothetical protein